MSQGIETIKTEQEVRIFYYYAHRLTDNAGQRGLVRFNVIEYLCNFANIDPYEMARHIYNNGFTIVFDDSSISRIENKRKESKFYA